MIPDIPFITSTFARFNELIFGSRLPQPRFRLTRARTFRGKLVYKYRRTLTSKICHDFEMRISVSFDAPREEWEDVVIHEMIHLHIAAGGLTDSSSHGPLFRRIMGEINRRHGRHISISLRATDEQHDADRQARPHFVCIIKFNDGRLAVAPVAKTRIFELWDRIPNFPDVAAARWVGTADPWFNRFPRVLTPKLYLTSEAELLPHLKGALLLECDGKCVRALSRRCSPDELLPQGLSQPDVRRHPGH